MFKSDQEGSNVGSREKWCRSSIPQLFRKNDDAITVNEFQTPLTSHTRSYIPIVKTKRDPHSLPFAKKLESDGVQPHQATWKTPKRATLRPVRHKRNPPHRQTRTTHHGHHLLEQFKKKDTLQVKYLEPPTSAITADKEVLRVKVADIAFRTTSTKQPEQLLSTYPAIIMYPENSPKCNDSHDSEKGNFATTTRSSPGEVRACAPRVDSSFQTRRIPSIAPKVTVTSAPRSRVGTMPFLPDF